MINNFNNVRQDLHNRFGHTLEAEIIDAIVDDVIAEHSASARVTDFLPVLVARDAARRIREELKSHGTSAAPRKRVLFVSRGNGSRAKLAASFAKRLSGDGVLATAAATHPENASDPRIIQIREERDLPAVAVTGRAGTGRTLDAPDVIVYMDATEEHDLPGLRQVQWDVPNPSGLTMGQIRDLADDLELRIVSLLDTLGVPVVARRETLLAA